jgi:CubicO group peptidase (beta-lactamase class C family)
MKTTKIIHAATLFAAKFRRGPGAGRHEGQRAASFRRGQKRSGVGPKNEDHDIFWIASMSKPMTSVAVAMLADDGKLSFDDPVEKYLPEFRDMWVAGEQTAQQRVLVKAARPITLRDLLTHTSGLGEYRVTDPHWTLAAMIKVLAREPLRFQPGTRWSYSTAGMDTLGRVVEVVSGMPYAGFCKRGSSIRSA